jgi:predicted RNase H-like HicB family nuclease
MKLYRLPLLMREPSDDTEDKYLAEVPALPGCRAWGDTAAEALENLQSVAAAFIESYRSRGDSLPSAVEAASSEPDDTHILSEVLVAV